MFQLMLCAAFFHIKKPSFQPCLAEVAKGIDPFRALSIYHKVPWLPTFREAKVLKGKVIITVGLTCSDCSATDIYHVDLYKDESIKCGFCGKVYKRK